MRRKRNKLASHPRFLLKLEKMIKNWEEAKNTDTYIFLKKPYKAMWANMAIGISRGVGFVIGASIVGAIVLTILGWVLSKFVTIPVIGEFIAIIVENVQNYLNK